EWDLDDDYTLISVFEYPKAFTWARMDPGHTDPEKREYIREIAAKSFPATIPDVQRWAFGISVAKHGNVRFDIDNVPKLIIDAFCKRQIREDNSKYPQVGLFEDDTIDTVRILNIRGERGRKDFTKVEIFGALN
ncbi:MAG: hypothetical protein HY435_00030, partial [Candidatus Liptonbacteria bacterium]|nr:hypothetical protein [Candidatus Liptonbacteria bacterium]